MIKVIVPDNPADNKKYDIITGLDINRPYLKRYSIKNYLSDRLHLWLENSNISYTLDYHEVSKDYIITCFWYIVFEKESDAVLFKLTWSGK
jgi:hypothetical protein